MQSPCRIFLSPLAVQIWLHLYAMDNAFMRLTRDRVCMQIRAAALTATQCASYDQAKQWWMRTTGMSDSFATHFGASMLTGLATTTVTAPVDLIKTRMFMSGGPNNTYPNSRCASDQALSEGKRGRLTADCC